MKKITWTESFSQSTGFSAEITDEQAELFKSNPKQFFDEVNFKDSQDLEWDSVYDENKTNYEIN